LCPSCIKVLVDAAVHSELRKVIKCDFKPGSVERSVDRYQRGYTSARCRQQAIFAISATNKNRAIFAVGITIHRPFFKFDSIREIL
jgi:hypothetical protein